MERRAVESQECARAAKVASEIRSAAMPDTTIIAVPKRGNRFCAARAMASDVNAWVTGSTLAPFWGMLRF